jgi:hypothetical protein
VRTRMNACYRAIRAISRENRVNTEGQRHLVAGASGGFEYVIQNYRNKDNELLRTIYSTALPLVLAIEASV